jgi:disulfide bond formation protein DsbB
MKEFIKKNALYGAFAVSLAAMLGSLYYSQILHLPPCVLCWYQRIAMYPIVVILAFAIYRRSRELVLPATVLAAVGWLIAVYHNLLYFRILPESAAPCLAGVSCSTKFEGWLATVPIPLQALAGFTFIIAMLIIYWRTQNND